MARQPAVLPLYLRVSRETDLPQLNEPPCPMERLRLMATHSVCEWVKKRRCNSKYQNTGRRRRERIWVMSCERIANQRND
ncbi:hypothetical protein RvY_16371 [Ramazzottius varieornatus]|uniref:Uncharacterized protein n=1 Tax=Ramazzottius varieornatus TaxID=947166 RepID=A0A1D1VY74_RAMVA|nr:hypothetical protein RvY_16371 [Ramazzottius varieornatus]